MTEADLKTLEDLADKAAKVIETTHHSKCYLNHKLCAIHALIAEVRRLRKTIVNTAESMLKGHKPTEEEWREWGRKFSS